MSMDALLKQMVSAAVQELIPHIVQAVLPHVQSAPPAAAQPQAFGGFPAAQPAATVQPAAQFGNFAAPAAQPASQVTPEMLQALIIPHINGPQGEAAKTLFGQQMQAMGIANLQDATAAQLPELYQRFQQAAAQLSAATPANPAGAATPSII